MTCSNAKSRPCANASGTRAQCRDGQIHQQQAARQRRSQEEERNPERAPAPARHVRQAKGLVSRATRGRRRGRQAGDWARSSKMGQFAICRRLLIRRGRHGDPVVRWSVFGVAGPDQALDPWLARMLRVRQPRMPSRSQWRWPTGITARVSSWALMTKKEPIYRAPALEAAMRGWQSTAGSRSGMRRSGRRTGTAGSSTVSTRPGSARPDGPAVAPLESPAHRGLAITRFEGTRSAHLHRGVRRGV